jgi:hypothetical protein
MLIRSELAVLLLFISTASLSRGADLEQLLIRATSADGTWAHVDGAVLMKGNQPVCAFGLRQLGDAKPQYTYFVLFRELPKSDDEFTVNGPLRSKSLTTNYTVAVAVGKRKVEIAHRMAVDGASKKLTTDDLRVAGEAIEPGKSRVFVVDLSAEPPSVKTLDLKPPGTVIDPRGDIDVGAVQKVTAEYIAASKELQKLLEAPK